MLIDVKFIHREDRDKLKYGLSNFFISILVIHMHFPRNIILILSVALTILILFIKFTFRLEEKYNASNLQLSINLVPF